MGERESAIQVRARCQCFREAGLKVDRKEGGKGRERKRKDGHIKEKGGRAVRKGGGGDSDGLNLQPSI